MPPISAFPVIIPVFAATKFLMYNEKLPFSGMEEIYAAYPTKMAEAIKPFSFFSNHYLVKYALFRFNKA